MRNEFPLTKTIITALLAVAGSAGSAVAAETASAAASADWTQTVFIYGMGASIGGTAQIGPVAVPVDVSFSQVLDHLEMTGMAAYRIENSQWSLTADATFMSLGVTGESDAGRVRGDLDVDQTTLMLTGGYRLTPHVEALFGVAWFDLSTKLEVRAFQGLSQQAKADASWVDPSIGLRYAVPVNDKWQFALRGDVGGFSVGSDLLVHALTTLRYQQSERIGWLFGYRIIDFDYEDGSGARYEKYDLREQGPVVALAISF